MQYGESATKKYRINNLLGEGSFGKVYACINTITGKRHAIKLVPKSSLNDPILVCLMKQELEIVAELDHPHIVRILELIEDERYYYTVSEVVSGGELG